MNELFENFKVKSSGNIPRMSSMLVGYFSYDIIRLIEKIPDKCKKDIRKKELLWRIKSHWGLHQDLQVTEDFTFCLSVGQINLSILVNEMKSMKFSVIDRIEMNWNEVEMM